MAAALSNRPNIVYGEAISDVMAQLAKRPRSQMLAEYDELCAKRADQSPRGGLTPRQLVRMYALRGMLTPESRP